MLVSALQPGESLLPCNPPAAAQYTFACGLRRFALESFQTKCNTAHFAEQCLNTTLQATCEAYGMSHYYYYYFYHNIQTSLALAKEIIAETFDKIKGIPIILQKQRPGLSDRERYITSLRLQGREVVRPYIQGGQS